MTEVALTAEQMAEAQEPEAAPSANVGTTPEPVAQQIGDLNVPPAPAPEPPLVEDEEDDVLDLVSLTPSRKLIKIPTPENPKGERFELRLLDDFGVVDQQALLSWTRRFENLWNNEEGDLTVEEQERMKWLLDKMFDKVLDAPAEVKATIADTIKSRVVTAFTVVPLLERRRQEQEAAEEQEAREAQKKSPSTTES